jgi:hypothetical protein
MANNLFALLTCLTLQSIVGNKYSLLLTLKKSAFCPQSVCIDHGSRNTQCLFCINFPLFVMETNYVHFVAADSLLRKHTNFVLQSVCDSCQLRYSRPLFNVVPDAYH